VTEPVGAVNRPPLASVAEKAQASTEPLKLIVHLPVSSYCVCCTRRQRAAEFRPATGIRGLDTSPVAPVRACPCVRQPPPAGRPSDP
jgi:hypothetical protein